MRKCMHCNIEVEGHFRTCPLCQNNLIGEPSDSFWPSTTKKLNKQSFAFKIQLFIVLSLSVVCFALDIFMDINRGFHWSLLVILCSLTIEHIVNKLIKTFVTVPKLITLSSIYLTILLLINAKYLGFWRLCTDYILPILCSCLILANLVLSIIDKTTINMMCLFFSILAGILTYPVLYFCTPSVSPCWIVCCMLGVIVLIGIIIFVGNQLMAEIQKRISI